MWDQPGKCSPNGPNTRVGGGDTRVGGGDTRVGSGDTCVGGDDRRVGGEMCSHLQTAHFSWYCLDVEMHSMAQSQWRIYILVALMLELLWGP